jgi:hypothetical protein
VKRQRYLARTQPSSESVLEPAGRRVDGAMLPALGAVHPVVSTQFVLTRHAARGLRTGAIT